MRIFLEISLEMHQNSIINNITIKAVLHKSSVGKSDKKFIKLTVNS